MASAVITHTLSTSSSSSPDPELFTPPPSHTTLQQVPDVFVIPPEEEHHDNPPFCYFDAAMESKKSLSVVPDMDALDVALGMCQQTDNRAPVFRRSMNKSQETIVMPKRSGTINNGLSAQHTRQILDEDVVEVVKVSRKDGVSNSPAEKRDTLKKSLTFRARATQAFRSIRNVSKGSRRAVSDGWDVPAGVDPAATEDGAVQSSKVPARITRKPSNLKQMFAPAHGRPVAPDVPTSPTSPTSSSEWSALSRPSLAPEDIQPTLPGNGAPIFRPSLSGKRSFVSRISAREIQRLFVPHSSKPAVSSPLKENMAPSSSHSSSKRESVMSSRTTASTGLSNVEDLFEGVAAGPRPHSFHGGSGDVEGQSLSTLSSSSLSETEPEEQIEDTSFELQLDSLHFESLHFDPEEFVFQLDSDP
jgi:hypothetical protein